MTKQAESIKSLRFSGRDFTREEIETIRGWIAEGKFNRNALSRQVCKEFNWVNQQKKLKEVSCRVALLRMHRMDLIKLPAPEKGNGNGKKHSCPIKLSAPQESICCSVENLGNIELKPVQSKQQRNLYRSMMQQYHYLESSNMAGAQLRYLIVSGQGLLGAIGWGASAWSIAPRDQFIGWKPHVRKKNLHLIVNNSRFLILPWVRCPNLASFLLARCARRLPEDWQALYGYSPVLLETFVEKQRFMGTCYRAANWRLLGSTTGRGKLEKSQRAVVPIKLIFVYPLRHDFRNLLMEK